MSLVTLPKYMQNVHPSPSETLIPSLVAVAKNILGVQGAVIMKKGPTCVICQAHRDKK